MWWFFCGYCVGAIITLFLVVRQEVKKGDSEEDGRK